MGLKIVEKLLERKNRLENRIREIEQKVRKGSVSDYELTELKRLVSLFVETLNQIEKEEKK